MISKFIYALLLSVWMISIYGCGYNKSDSASHTPCTKDWFEAIELKLVSGDGQGHGPDIGSMEWRSVIEFKLGVRGLSKVPNRETNEWCEYIDGLVFNESR